VPRPILCCERSVLTFFCAGQTGTYNGKYADGSKSFGGYADFSRVPGHFVVKIPDGIPSALAAPLLCGGVTVYSPLRQYGAGTERKHVGIIGIGGLGHFGLLFAKAMGAEVTAISHSASKKKDAEAMGASHFIATADGDHVFKENANKLDLIVATTNDENMPLAGYLQLLKPHGYLVFVRRRSPVPPMAC
jgi:alcohol dehydrogenase (NADP+)